MALFVTPRQFSLRADFYFQLAQLTSAGIPIHKAIELQAKSPPSSAYREPLLQIFSLLQQGETFAGALSRLARWTPGFDLALIDAGEKSGRLDMVFGMLGDFYRSRAQLLRQVLGQMAYPTVVLHMAVLIFPFISFMKDFSVPLFLLRTLGVLIPLYLLLGFVAYAAQAERSAAWRSRFERIVNLAPILGTARRSLALARLAAALEALLNAGVNIVEAWDLAAAASGSPALERAVGSWRPAVLAGQTPAEAVSASSYFPSVFQNLYMTGEVSGELDNSLKRLHHYYQDEGERRMRALAEWVPWCLYMMVALFVAYKIISFYAGYVNQLRQVGGW